MIPADLAVFLGEDKLRPDKEKDTCKGKPLEEEPFPSRAGLSGKISCEQGGL